MDEDVLYEAFINGFNTLVDNRAELIKKWKAEDGNELARYRTKEFIQLSKDKIDGFDVDLFFRTVNKMTVFEKQKVIVSFLDGTEVECIIE